MGYLRGRTRLHLESSGEAFSRFQQATKAPDQFEKRRNGWHFTSSASQYLDLSSRRISTGRTRIRIQAAVCSIIRWVTLGGFTGQQMQLRPCLYNQASANRDKYQNRRTTHHQPEGGARCLGCWSTVTQRSSTTSALSGSIFFKYFCYIFTQGPTVETKKGGKVFRLKSHFIYLFYFEGLFTASQMCEKTCRDQWLILLYVAMWSRNVDVFSLSTNSSECTVLNLIYN